MAVDYKLPPDALLAAIVRSSDDAIVSKDLRGTVTSWNQGAELLFGYSAEEMIGRPIATIAAPGREYEMSEILARVLRGEKVDHYETLRRRKDGRLAEISLTVSPIVNAAGQVIGASKIARDISERKKQERQLQILMGELNHRSRNLLAVAQAIIHLTHRDTVQELKEVVRDRIAALGQVHGVIAEGGWEKADLQAVALSGLRPFCGGDRQLVCAGDDIDLTPAGAQALALILHELATNAAKYGAWTKPSGLVRLSWTQEADTVLMDWQETGGPPVSEPSRRNFGMRLIEQQAAVLGGTTSLEWHVHGLRCRFGISGQYRYAPPGGVLSGGV